MEKNIFDVDRLKAKAAADKEPPVSLTFTHKNTEIQRKIKMKKRDIQIRALRQQFTNIEKEIEHEKYFCHKKLAFVPKERFQRGATKLKLFYFYKQDLVKKANTDQEQ